MDRALGRGAASLAVAVAAVAGLASCTDWLGGDSKGPPLPGERIAVLVGDEALKPDQAVADRRVILPRPYVNEAWPQAGGYPTNAMYHLALAPGIARGWRTSVGSGIDSDNALLAMPLVVGNRIFAMDAVSNVGAYEEATGRRIWRTRVTPREDRDANLGGGIAYDSGVLVAATGFAQVVALRGENGQELWRVPVPGPVRSAPVVAGGRVFVVTLDNQAIALSLRDGTRQWSHQAGAEAPGMLGGSGPATDGDIVVVPYSTGDVVGLDAATGRVRWSDSVVAARRVGGGIGISDIRGRPVIDRDMVFVIGSSERMVAVDRGSGARIWERDIGGVDTPWAAGDYVYVLTGNGEIVCLTRADGLVRWVKGLPRFERPRERKRPIRWMGPALASDRLLILGSHGEAWSLSPYDGQLLGAIELREKLSLPPVIANGSLYILRNDGDLSTYR
ncbi:MAG: PQQ-binding-like beta-propeller repeat protein [Alphaproteobacteria bacterium]|nr:PQQ-binding-like beta-propeller repeat protein [Alphaproteobacteria bacterium]